MNPSIPRKSPLLVSAVLFLILLGAYAFVFPRWADWNQNSRLDLILAVVDRGTLTIDDYYENTGDYAFFNGHYYSDKAPGSSFLGIPVYWVFRHTFGPALSSAVLPRLMQNQAMAATLNANGTGLLADKVYTVLALAFVTFFVVAVPSALLGVLLYLQLGKFSANELYKFGITYAFALATPAFAYSNNLLGHQIAAFAVFAAFFFLFDLHRETARRRVWFKLVVVGLLFGLALITEYPTGLIVAGLGVYALYQAWLFARTSGAGRPWGMLLRAALAVAIGSLPLILLASAYNYAIFGTPLPVGYEYSVLWQDTHRIGLLSLTYPKLDALWGITLSPYRGLFFFAPFLLLAIPGFYFFGKDKRYRPAFLVVLWSAVSFLLFNASSAMWDGGFSVGPRYLVPALPFMALPIIFLLKGVRKRWLTLVFFASAALSLLMIWTLTLSGQGFPQYEKNPLLEYSLPRLWQGDIARNVGSLVGLRGAAGLLPLIFFLAAGILLLWFLTRAKPESNVAGESRQDSKSTSAVERYSEVRP